MKICGLTQTYGDRSLELDVLLQNNLKLDIMNSLDGYRINYHNSKLNEIYNSKFQNLCKNISFKNYDVVTYGFTIYYTLKELKSKGFTDILFCQDDHYFIQNEKVKNALFKIIEYYKELKPNILYLSNRFDKYIPTQIFSSNGIVYEEFNCSKLSSEEYGYCDSPYLANIDFLLKHVFTKEKSHMSVWDIEISTKQHFYDDKIFIQQAKMIGSYCANFSGRNVATVLSPQQKVQYILGNGDRLQPEIKSFYDYLDKI